MLPTTPAVFPDEQELRFDGVCAAICSTLAYVTQGRFVALGENHVFEFETLLLAFRLLFFRFALLLLILITQKIITRQSPAPQVKRACADQATLKFSSCQASVNQM